MKYAVDGPLAPEEVEANRAERIFTERVNGTYEEWGRLKFRELVATREAGLSEKRVRNPHVTPATAEMLRKQRDLDPVVDGIVQRRPRAERENMVGRNKLCPCGSGRKAKFCCLS